MLGSQTDLVSDPSLQLTVLLWSTSEPQFPDLYNGHQIPVPQRIWNFKFMQVTYLPTHRYSEFGSYNDYYGDF